MKFFCNIIFCFLFSGLTLSAAEIDSPTTKPLPNAKAEWSTLAKNDIEAAYRLSAENHPGMFDINNPKFPVLLKHAKAEALILSGKANGPQGYAASIARFRTILQDGHAGAIYSLPTSMQAPRLWPGFSAVWRGHSLKVFYSATKNIKKGDRINKCNGQSIETLMRDRVFTFHGEVDQPGHWWSQGWRLLIDDGNPFLTSLKECEFIRTNGEAYSAALNWSVRPADIDEYIQYAYNGDKLSIDINWFDDDIAWIAMPTFSPSDQETALYYDLFEQLAKQQEQLIDARAVVLDLRHNQGGSSFWSTKIAKGLWGEKQVDHARQNLFASTEIWWRASSGNLLHIEELQTLLKDQEDTVQWITEIGNGVQASLLAGENFYVEYSKKSKSRLDIIPTNSHFKTKVFVIVPSQCASACLDAIDTFKLFPNTKLIGAPSSSDSTYMEVRLENLPSGLGQVIIPNKVYVNRPRGKGYFYQPDIPYNELDWTTDALLEQIKNL